MLNVPSPEPPRAREWRTALVIGLVVFVVFNANLRTIAAGDTLPARYLPLGILGDRSLAFDRLGPMTAQGLGYHAYWLIPGRGGRWISLYPVVLPVLVAPLYVPAFLYLNARVWDPPRVELVARVMEKLTASLIASATTALLYLLVRRRVRRGTAILIALVFALGTTTWVISSQALWQHGLAQLLATGALLLVTGRVTTGRAMAFGTLCGLLAGNRPPDALLAAALGAAGLLWAGRRALLVAGAAAVPAGLVLAYNVSAAGHLAGGYGLYGKTELLTNPLLSGLAGLLVSPAKGLLVFSPFLIALLFGAGRIWSDRQARPLTAALAAGAAAQLVLYAKYDWRAGASWGPRYLTDLLPFLFWMLAPVVDSLRGARRALFAGACGVAVAIELVGAFWYTGTSDDAILAEARGAWPFANAPFVKELEHAPAVPDLLTEVRGSIDRIVPAGREGEEITAGDSILVKGWTLAGRSTPHAVRLLLDGAVAGTATSFLGRPDVAAAMGTAAPMSWTVTLEAHGLAPGEHVLALQALVGPHGEARYVTEKRFAVRPPASGGDDLAASARRASAALRERQSPAGWWPTAYTVAPRWEQPAAEMNTFLTSMLADLLAPLANGAGLGESVERARRHLAAQIEGDGLVRYHGLPDGPTIGTLGCAITPDTDDTALVWRIAPGAKASSLKDAVRTIGQYRRADGLYRTWLAPRDRYQCLDPGSDPNPADVAIQMHLLLLLRGADPPAARSLCSALGRRIDDEAIWVYYRRAPLVPILRQGELAAGGCSFRLPDAHLRTDVPGQETWVTASRLLSRLAAGAERPERAEILAVLRAISADDFALLRRSPPLLYHNDLSASVSRYYWSEDFGRALWLRLLHEDERAR